MGQPLSKEIRRNRHSTFFPPRNCSLLGFFWPFQSKQDHLEGSLPRILFMSDIPRDDHLSVMVEGFLLDLKTFKIHLSGCFAHKSGWRILKDHLWASWNLETRKGGGTHLWWRQKRLWDPPLNYIFPDLRFCFSTNNIFFRGTHSPPTFYTCKKTQLYINPPGTTLRLPQLQHF